MALIGVTVGFLGLFLLAPLIVVGVEASRKGWDGYLSALADPDARAAILLTLLVAAIVVPLNTAFGLSAAWAISKFQFRGKAVLTTLIDLPFSVSPVVSGLVFVLLFGAQGLFGTWLAAHGVQIIFAVPGIVLATLFVTFPVRRARGHAADAGTGNRRGGGRADARGERLTVFRTVTLPNVKWALLSGVLLTNARSMGEFGAVSVVSGHIRGLTNTIPLQVEILYNEYSIAAAFTLASLLAGLALVTLGLKTLFERRGGVGAMAYDLAAESVPALASPHARSAAHSARRREFPSAADQGLRRAGRPRPDRPRHRARRTLGAARAVGLGQDHAAALARGPRLRVGRNDPLGGEDAARCRCRSAGSGSCSSPTRCSAT